MERLKRIEHLVAAWNRKEGRIGFHLSPEMENLRKSLESIFGNRPDIVANKS